MCFHVDDAFRRVRDHLIFGTLKDSYGEMQLLFEKNNDAFVSNAMKVPLESVITISGTVRRRPTTQSKVFSLYRLISMSCL